MRRFRTSVAAVALLGSLALAAPVAATAHRCPSKDARLVAKAVSHRLATYGYSDVSGRCWHIGSQYEKQGAVECYLEMHWRHDRRQPHLRPALTDSYTGAFVRSGFFAKSTYRGTISVSFVALERNSCPARRTGYPTEEQQLQTWLDSLLGSSHP